jgi:hypothetical protein
MRKQKDDGKDEKLLKNFNSAIELLIQQIYATQSLGVPLNYFEFLTCTLHKLTHTKLTY